MMWNHLLPIIPCKRQIALPSIRGAANLFTQLYLPYLQYYPCPHFNGLTACFLSLFLSLGETKKDDSVKGYDESSRRIFMARPTPSRAASCSPCVHQYKTDNVQLMQRHVVQMHTHDFWM